MTAALVARWRALNRVTVGMSDSASSPLATIWSASQNAASRYASPGRPLTQDGHPYAIT
jgi:hypothetical protein